MTVTPDSADESLASAEPPSVSVEWNALTPLNVGQDCDCELIVTNSGKSVAHHVAVEAHLPKSVHVAYADPQPDEQRESLGWRIEALEPGEVRKIKLILLPYESGVIEAEAHVRFTGTSVKSFTVSQPMLEVAMSGAKDAAVGEPTPQTVTVSNPGTGVASNVKLEAAIPEGLEHSRGKKLLMEIGSLNPGESRTVRLALTAVTGGDHILQVQASADSNLVKTAEAQVHVVAPSLAATIDGPGLRYLGREATYTLHVRNDGSAATDNVRVMHRVPEGFEFVRSDRGARFDQSTRILSWFVGRLESGQSQALNVTLKATQMGEFAHDIRAISEHGARTDARLITRVEGVASLAIEVSDLEDPVEVGRETAYEVRITNEGTAPARQVGLVCDLPEGMTFLKASGPSPERSAAASVAFRPLPELGAGETVTYRLHVSGERAGDVRFRARLTSASVGQPLLSEELTKFYGE